MGDRRDRRARHVQLARCPTALSASGRHRQPPRRAARRRPAACRGCRRRARTTRATCSRSTAGANGRNDSRNLIFRFITDCIFGDRASPMIERPPSARGPNSMRPCNRPTTFSSASSAATRSASADAVDAARRVAVGRRRTPAISRVAELRPEERAAHAVGVARHGARAATGRAAAPRCRAPPG